MIEFHYELDFQLPNETDYGHWLRRIISSEDAFLDHLNYIFCTDEYLLEINRKHLYHDYYTDVISFQYADNQNVKGDIFVSLDRIKDNSKTLNVKSDVELRRVMAHGLLHLLGYMDKTDDDRKEMRLKENEKLEMFHVEQ